MKTYLEILAVLAFGALFGCALALAFLIACDREDANPRHYPIPLPGETNG